MLGGCLGVLLGRVWRSVAVAPLVLVGLAVGSLTLADLYVGGHDQRSWVWLGTLLRPVTIDPPPVALLGRPATWHLIYLLGAAGRPGRAGGVAQPGAFSQARLASNVAARVIGPPDHLPQPSGEQPKPSPGSAAELPALIEGCNARAVVALWLAVRASPHAAVGLRQQVTDARYPSIVFTNDVGSDEPIWGVREGRFALALLDRPSDQVTQTLWRNWDLLMAPATTLERLGELVGVQPPPHRASAPEFGDKPC